MARSAAKVETSLVCTSSTAQVKSRVTRCGTGLLGSRLSLGLSRCGVTLFGSNTVLSTGMIALLYALCVVHSVRRPNAPPATPRDNLLNFAGRVSVFLTEIVLKPDRSFQ